MYTYSIMIDVLLWWEVRAKVWRELAKAHKVPGRTMQKLHCCKFPVGRRFPVLRVRRAVMPGILTRGCRATRCAILPRGAISAILPRGAISAQAVYRRPRLLLNLLRKRFRIFVRRICIVAPRREVAKALGKRRAVELGPKRCRVWKELRPPCLVHGA